MIKKIKSAYAKATARQRKIKKDGEKGLTILYAVIVSIIMLSVATSVSSIALRQTKLSSTGRESQYAFFAANTGLECARYWDLKTYIDGKPAFATSSSFDSTSDFLTCNGINLNKTNNNSTPSKGITDFNFLLTPDTTEPNRQYLVEVTVAKTSTSTLITSRGYNTKTATATNAVQRGLEMFYSY